ncbi:MAG: hypothetical protein IKI30_04150 [Oxalobacter sp.]|nr:hypothetical protein [Oxalobacter sp.]
MKLKEWLLLLTATSMAICLSACGNKEKPSASQANQGTDQPQQVDAKLPDVTTTPAEMAKAYADNSVSADQQFKGKLILVSGTVSEISNDANGNPYITMASGSFKNIPRFQFDKNNLDELAMLQKGQKLTVICTGDGDDAKTPVNKGCRIIQSTSNGQQGLQSIQETKTPAPAPAPSQGSGNALSRGHWTYLASFPNINGITTNHIYIDRRTKVGNSSLVRTTLEYGNLDGWSLIYRKEADCYSNMLRTVSTVSWYNASGNYAKEAQPTNPDWQTAKNAGDRALIRYLCR